MQCLQELDTSGARAVETFVHAGVRYLVVPQLAYDMPGQPAQMTLGNSDTDALVYRWDGGRFVEHARLGVPGGEDAEYFRIGTRGFLATASLRTGSNPYDLNVSSTIFEIVGRPLRAVPEGARLCGQAVDAFRLRRSPFPRAGAERRHARRDPDAAGRRLHPRMEQRAFRGVPGGALGLGLQLGLLRGRRAPAAGLCGPRRAFPTAALERQPFRAVPGTRWQDGQGILLLRGRRQCLAGLRQPASRHAALPVARAIASWSTRR